MTTKPSMKTQCEQAKQMAKVIRQVLSKQLNPESEEVRCDWDDDYVEYTISLDGCEVFESLKLKLCFMLRDS